MSNRVAVFHNHPNNENSRWPPIKHALYFSPFVIIDANLCRVVLLHWQTNHIPRAADIINILNIIITVILIIIVINVADYPKEGYSDV